MVVSSGSSTSFIRFNPMHIKSPPHLRTSRPTSRGALCFVLFITCAFGACGPGEPPPEVCSSPLDEDGDGVSGCSDPDCWIAGGSCVEACATQFDEDGDGQAACADSDCWVDGGECAEVCDSDEDEDGDGAAGCDDSDCWGATGNCPEVCETDNDEDGDGNGGCEDSECWVEGGACAEKCTGGNDEDVDGTVDCEDPDCRLDKACAPTFTGEIQALFLQHCGKCHSGDEPAATLNFELYANMKEPSNYCTGQTRGECALFRILEPSMPQDCPGCVPKADVDQIAYWIEAGMPE